MTSVLVVEDDRAIQELLAFSLTQAGYKVTQALSAEIAMESIKRELPDVIVLDWMLPQMSGLALAKLLRADRRTRSLPIIMVTARGDEPDKLAGLEHGADDYLTKPFSPKELLARIKAVLRRRSPEDAGDPLRVGTVQLDPVRYRVTIQDQEIILGPTEFKLLQFFLANPDRVFSRDQVLDRVWGDHRFLELRTVDVYIRRLRAALRNRGVDGLIETVRGVGYRCAPEALG
ncbi:MAG: phosphate regulon transcriptional regulator PhoB [Betaproteobacteria bacterium]|nr:phosphate regulon transcriptional regulator PhoB [Betaproteobacteria bacterium]MBK9608962.1 phosphate regulon transcriptional regulator PhoB [Betaproteobacteria bacterium]